MHVLEWTIENFSCWRSYIHEKKIEWPGSCFISCSRIVLYPKGLNGCGEHIVVHIYFSRYALSGEPLPCSLSLIDSSGSLIFIKKINKNNRADYFEFLPRLRFEEVAAQIKKNGALHQDRLILRYEFNWIYELKYSLYTTIDASDSSIKFNCSILGHTGNNSYPLLVIQYPFEDSEEELMPLSVLEEKTVLSIEPKDFKKDILVITSVSLLKYNSVIRTEEKEHVFHDCTKWQFFQSLTKKELNQDYSLRLRIKIISRIKYRHRYGYYTSYSDIIATLPASVSQHPSGALKEPLMNKPTDMLTNQSENSVAVLSKEMMCLYQDHDFSDFQLNCGKVCFPTHKSILSARSPVFKAMLSCGMRESTSDSMDIPDLDVPTATRFLEFLYSGTVDDLQWESALKLYYAADKYQVPTLKEKCFSVLGKAVSISSVCDILSLADKHRDAELLFRARVFILKNFNDVLRSDEWKNLMNTDPVLAVKTVTYFGEENFVGEITTK